VEARVESPKERVRERETNGDSNGTTTKKVNKYSSYQMVGRGKFTPEKEGQRTNIII
jgi:hypothetical protein